MKPLKLGMPYMGSKRAIAQKIVDRILIENPNTKYVYDLFGGGGAISFEFLQRLQIKKVVYNELNTGVVELLNDIKENGITEKYFQWIDRQTFLENKDKDTWLGGFCKVVWSFGNNQRNYLFGKNNEDIKREAHFYLLNNGYKLGDNKSKLINQFKNEKNIKGEYDLHQLERLQQLEQLGRLQQLERLQQLQQLERLEIQNKSYSEVEITTPINETVIYLDPPYFRKSNYQKDINHQELYEWINNCPYRVYLSSYEAPFKLVDSSNHRCKLNPNQNQPVKENLYIKDL